MPIALRSAGLATLPMTGPRLNGSEAPQRMGKRTGACAPGCEVRRIWVERFVLMLRAALPKPTGAPKGAPIA